MNLCNGPQKCIYLFALNERHRCAYSCVVGKTALCHHTDFLYRDLVLISSFSVRPVFFVLSFTLSLLFVYSVALTLTRGLNFYAKL